MTARNWVRDIRIERAISTMPNRKARQLVGVIFTDVSAEELNVLTPICVFVVLDISNRKAVFVIDPQRPELDV